MTRAGCIRQVLNALKHCRLVILISKSCVCRLRSHCRGFTEDRRMPCTPHRKALRTKSVMSMVGKICSCQWASASNQQPMGSLHLCSSHRVTLRRGWHSAALACRPCWVGTILQLTSSSSFLILFLLQLYLMYVGLWIYCDFVVMCGFVMCPHI